MENQENHIESCTMIPVRESLLRRSVDIAIAENPKNGQVFREQMERAPYLLEAPSFQPNLNPLRDPSNSYLMAGSAFPQSSLLYIFFEKGKLWAPGRVIPVFFFGGTPQLIDRVMESAREWEEHANIRFRHTTDRFESLIRIGFYPGEGHFSYVGTDALLIPKWQITMNLDGYSFYEGMGDSELNRVVKHEFGHAIGAPHEHSHPQQTIPWDYNALYEHYERTQGWGKSQVDSQVIQKYSFNQVAFGTEYDPNSIMHYPISNNLTRGNYEVPWNIGLSDLDKEGIGLAYS